MAEECTYAGERNLAEMVAQQYKKLYGMNAEGWSLETIQFQVPEGKGREGCFEANS